MQIDDLNFSDDLAILSHSYEQMQIKTTSVSAASAAVGLNIHKGKSKILKSNKENTNSITFHGEALKRVETFTYLVSSIIDKQGRFDTDVKSRITKIERHSHS
ncbi:unnamed protein product [Schistosoma margrebowiei]|uniref:Uncharacterized protein n=1 Tax=Schistosoma margrebowiei TaxID=48269 RepID=A0A183MQW3_9TREM|nr:unnamed protein product [Schistosoma margrebowiei]